MASAYVKFHLLLDSIILVLYTRSKGNGFLPSKASVLKGFPVSLFRKCCRLLMVRGINDSVCQMFPLAGGAEYKLSSVKKFREKFSIKICFLALYFFLFLRII